MNSWPTQQFHWHKNVNVVFYLIRFFCFVCVLLWGHVGAHLYFLHTTWNWSFNFNYLFFNFEGNWFRLKFIVLGASGCFCPCIAIVLNRKLTSWPTSTAWPPDWFACSFVFVREELKEQLEKKKKGSRALADFEDKMNDVCLLIDDLPPSFTILIFVVMEKKLYYWPFLQNKANVFVAFFYPLIFRNGEKN